MNNRRQQNTNPIPWAKVTGWILVAAVVLAAGLGFVFVKIQQHVAGTETRELERQLRDVVAMNQVLSAEVTSLTSRSAMQDRLHGGLIALMPIPGTSIARLTPPTLAVPGDVVRTASALATESFAQ